MPTERRKSPRLGLAIPVRVQGFLADGTTWDEMTTTLDVSAGGACFPLTHEADLGQVLLLSLALPKRLRQFDLTDASYRVYSLVRGVRRTADPARVGIMFFGKFPPRAFNEKPGARYLFPNDSLVNAPVPRGLREGDGEPDGPSLDTLVGEPVPAGRRASPEPSDGPTGEHAPPALSASAGARGRAGVPPAPLAGVPAREFEPPVPGHADRRQSPRVDIFVNFTIQLVDEWGVVLQEELTVADNVSQGGARVMTSLGFEVGEVVLLQEAGGGFATRAEVRAKTRVQATVDRLHLRFLDRQAPDRLLKQ
ncbi:MAG TPA: PilZ domain-containing protein [Vicinamibacteria bacterium]|nr:PilZ domain-containing protein [Vicinamibacteria bacterium]